jgi:hypothetical protein
MISITEYKKVLNKHFGLDWDTFFSPAFYDSLHRGTEAHRELVALGKEGESEADIAHYSEIGYWNNLNLTDCEYSQYSHEEYLRKCDEVAHELGIMQPTTPRTDRDIIQGN